MQIELPRIGASWIQDAWKLEALEQRVPPPENRLNSRVNPAGPFVQARGRPTNPKRAQCWNYHFSEKSLGVVGRCQMGLSPLSHGAGKRP